MQLLFMLENPVTGVAAQMVANIKIQKTGAELAIYAEDAPRF
jgi:hypothetical protein